MSYGVLRTILQLLPPPPPNHDFGVDSEIFWITKNSHLTVFAYQEAL